MMIREALKWAVFPGMNLNARQRYRRLPQYFGAAAGGQERWVLDAGCGNGMLSYQSYLKGNRVIGVSIKEGEVARNRRLFNEYLRVPSDRLEFRVLNLREVEALGRQFDEIICSEVLEHIVDDRGVCEKFHKVLRPGGTLHLCCPNADHPLNRNGPLDADEKGGHVRPGYTLATFRSLLEPLGFSIEQHAGLGGPVRQFFNQRIIKGEAKLGRFVAAALFALSLPFLLLDRGNAATPYSIYILARKEW
jgi:SAM-dependent methyltransferase